ncbi:MAG: redoxin domain-containing protein [Myxococcota bacterium]
MILRTLASLVLLALLAANALLPSQPWAERGPENRVRQDFETSLAIGQTLPDLALRDLEGRPFTREDLAGRRVLLTFERSLDWCPASKARLVELRDAFAETPDLQIVWVMSDMQLDERARIFVAELGLTDRILFLVDPKSSLIRQLGVLKENPERIEVGVPHPTTLLLDRRGTIRFVDVRENFHYWLAPRALADALASIE